MKKYVLAVVLLLFHLNFSFCQKLETGLYVLSQNGETFDIVFSNDSFQLFKPNGNDVVSSGSRRKLINQIGYGKYLLSKRNLILFFDSATHRITDYSSDSIHYSFSTNPLSKTVNFTIDLKFSIPENGNNGLIISSYKREYFYPLKKETLTVNFPDSILIKDVRLGVMGYEHRILPYDSRYNNFKYSYFFNDDQEHLSFIKAQTWNFRTSAEKRKGNVFFTIGDNGYLKKAEEKDEKFFNKAIAENPKLKGLTGK